MKALTAAEMREVDRLTTERFGVPGQQLMEAAGKSVAEVFLEQYGHKNSEAPGFVAVLCGKGNNGGDGFVVARDLHEEADRVQLYLFARPEELKGDAARNFERWRALGGGVTVVQTEADWKRAWGEISGADVIVDALLGTGMRGVATGLLGWAIEDVNRLSRDATAARPGWIVAVDTPSGLPSDGEAAEGPVIKAHWTVTFTAPKIGQLISPSAGCCGRLVVREIGSPPALIEEVGKGEVRWAGPDEFAGLPLVRAAESHKGSFGHALIVAGSVGKTGAAIMAGNAALRAGAGLVTIATPESVLPIIAAAHPEYMTEALPGTDAGSLSTAALTSGRYAQAVRGKSVVAMGPGAGQHPDTQEFIRTIVADTEVPMVLDADGLNAFDGRGESLSRRKSEKLVVTPHPGEMARLLGSSIAEVQKDRVKTALEAARKWNAQVVLKGFHTIVASPKGQLFVNTSGNPALAKGGSGDVLTGLLAGLIAQFGADDLVRVVALGVYLHGRAADLLSEQADASGILAGEVAQAIPFARQKLLEELQRRV
ncbi:MAG TPA: NAD(P)H-hydrate dehydratase [Candidatus Acidoferrum sp.]|nr:NAD(P)H-hydrate dehydratase [Candidatus Acidoferrum sp.]